MYSSICMVYFYGVLVGFLVVDLEIGERKYIKTIIFSIKYIYNCQIFLF
jgi:hypothetical protein